MADTEENSKKEHLNDIFQVVGSYGPWQRNFFILYFVYSIIDAWQSFSITFLAPNVDYWCSEFALADNLSAVSQNLHFQNNSGTVSVALQNASRSGLYKNRCTVPIYALFNDTNQQLWNGSSYETVRCERWEYDFAVHPETITSKFDLVCDREWLLSFIKSVYMIGFLVSVIFFGQMSDCIGRLRTMVISYVVTLVSLVLTLFSSSYAMFVVLQFFQAFGRTGLGTTQFVLLMEMVGYKHRTEAGIIVQIGWSIGLASLPAVAWFFKHWFWLQLVLTVLFLPIAFAYKIVPESPRWLLSTGKTKRFEEVVSNAAQKNGRVLDVKTLELLKNCEQSHEGSRTILDLLKSPKIRCRTFNMIYHWIVNAFMYYAVSFNTNDLSGDPYLNFFLAGIVEVPCYVAIYYGAKYLGRKPTLVSLMLVAGIASAAVIPVPADLPWLVVTFSMVTKFCISGSFGVLYLYTSEVFPTVIRNVAIGTCSMCARFGSIISPFVRELGKATHPSVPYVIYAVAAILSVLLACLLPETKDVDIPDSLQEGEYFGLSSTAKNKKNLKSENDQ